MNLPEFFFQKLDKSIGSRSRQISFFDKHFAGVKTSNSPKDPRSSHLKFLYIFDNKNMFELTKFQI